MVDDKDKNKMIKKQNSTPYDMGKIIGAIEFVKSVNMTEEQITEHIIKKLGLSDEEAKKKIKEVSDDQVGGN